jgi:hypothetical protein
MNSLLQDGVRLVLIHFKVIVLILQLTWVTTGGIEGGILTRVIIALQLGHKGLVALCFRSGSLLVVRV